MITVVKTRMDYVRLSPLMPSGTTAPVLARDGECSDRYKLPICTIILCLLEALLSLSILYSRIQPVPTSYSIYPA